MASTSPAASVPEARPPSPSTQMRQAAMQGNTELLSQLLLKHPSQVDGSPTSTGQPPLLVAALMGQKPVVELLLTAGSNPNKRGKRQETPLMLAAQRGHVEVMRLLLSRGAQPTAVDQRGWTALHFGAFSGHVSAVKTLLSSAAVPRKTILEIRTAKGETALALAAFGRKDDNCRALLQAGAKPSLVADAGDRDYAQKILDAMGPIAADDAASSGGDAPSAAKGLSTLSPPPARPRGAGASLAARRGGGRVPVVTDLPTTGVAGNGHHADSPGGSPSARPAMQFSGTPSEFERLITPQQSETSPGGGRHPAKLRSGSPSRMAVTNGPYSPKQSLKTADDATSWALHELDYRGTPLLHHRATGLIFTSVPEDSFPSLVGLMADGKPRWLGEADLSLLESLPEVSEALSSTVPVARLLRRLGVVSGPVLRLCVLLGLYEISELRELVLLEPGTSQYDSAWEPAALPPGHIAQLRPLLKAELLKPPANGAEILSEDGSWPAPPDSSRAARPPTAGAGGGGVVGPDDDSVAAAGPLPVKLVGLPLVQHLLERYGLAKLMVQVAELEITAAPDLLVLAHPGSWSGAGSLGSWEAGRLARMLRDLPQLLVQHSKARDRAETEAAMGPALEALMRQRRLEALARPTRGSLVTYDDIDGVAGGAARAGRRNSSRVAVVLEDDSSSDGKFAIRDIESDRILHVRVGHIRRVRASDASKLVRQDYAPPVSVGVPVTPLSAAPGLLVTRGSTWGRGSAYDVYGEGIVGELVGPEEVLPEEAEEDVEVIDAADGTDGAGGDSAAAAAAKRRCSGRWLVRWPDGQVHSYSIGLGGSFELSFLGAHWRSGAPLLDAHRGLLLAPAEVAVVPVSRGPTWSGSADDGLPGSPGAALLDRTTASLTVHWLRDLHCPRAYQPDPNCSGAYPVVHAMMAGQPVTLFTARQGARVEPAGLYPQAMSGGPGLSGTHFYHKYYQSWRSSAPEAVGPGILLAPLRLEKDGLVVVWLVSWPHASRQEARVGPTPGYCDLVFAPLADAPQAKNRLPHEHWHHQNAEGRLVRLNPAQLALQPNAAGGPLRLHSRDVGVVVRDMGPGVHCGLLVRQLAGATSYWYDEDVLLPLTPVEIRRLPPALAAALAVGNAAVPVLDCTAMPGMLVRRCYDDGSSLKCSGKEQQVGILVAPVASGRWLVRWSDGASAVYSIGSGNKFQLSYVCEHPQAGAPLAMPRSLDPRVVAEAPVVPGFDCCTPFTQSADPTECDVVMVGGAALQVEEEDKLRLLALELMPLTISPGAKQFHYFAGGLFRLFELSHAAVPGQPVTVFTAKQGLRVSLHPTEPNVASSGGGAAVGAGGGGVSASGEENGGAAEVVQLMGTLTRPLRLGSKGVGIQPPSPRSPTRNGRGGNRVRPPYSPRAPDIDVSESLDASAEVDSSIVIWEVVWDNGNVATYAVGLSPSVTALLVAPQPGKKGVKAAASDDEEGTKKKDLGFRTPAPVAPRDPADRRLRIHDPVLHLPLKGLQVLDDHIYSLVSNLDSSTCALNATAQQLANLWLSAATCEPVSRYRVVVQRMPMHADTLVLTVGPAVASPGKKDESKLGVVGHLDPEEAQDLLRAVGREDTELAAAAVALEAALRGAPHLDLETQRAKEKAALERQRQREAAGSRGPTEDGANAQGSGSGDDVVPVEGFNGRWIITGMSYEDAAADAAVSLAVVPGGGEGGSSDGMQIVITRPCSAVVAAAVQRFNEALKAAQEALDGAASGQLRYQVTVIPRPSAAAMPLGLLELGKRKPDPLLVQEMLETFHAFHLFLVEAPSPNGPDAGGDPTPLGPMAAAALDLVPELRSALHRAHGAMSEYAGAQAAEWRRQIREMYDRSEDKGAGGRGGAGAGPGAGGDDYDDDGDGVLSEVASSELAATVAAAEADGTRRGGYNGLSLTTTSPPLLAVQGGISVGDMEGLVVASEDATGLTPSEVAARFNDALLQLWRAAGRANGCGGSPNVSEGVVKVYRYVHEQVSKAVAAHAITFMAQDAGNMRKQVTTSVTTAETAVKELRSLAAAGLTGAAGGDEGEGGDGGGAAAAATMLARLKEGVAQVRRTVTTATGLAADVLVAAGEAADAADEQGKKGLAASSEELLQDAIAAGAVVTAARWAATSSNGTAAAARAAAEAANIIVEFARELAEAAEGGGAATRPVIELAVASASSLIGLANTTATAAKQQRETAVSMMQERMDGATEIVKALTERVSELGGKVSQLEAAAAAGSGNDQLLTKLRADLETAQDCTAKAGAAVAAAAEVRDTGVEDSEVADVVADEALERTREAAREAAGVQASLALALAASAEAGAKEPGAALVTLTQAWTALEFAGRVHASAVPSSYYETVAGQVAELCNGVVNDVLAAASDLSSTPKDPDRISPKQRNLSTASALLREMVSLALKRSTLSLPATAASTLARAAASAAKVCVEIVRDMQAIGAEVQVKARVAMNTREGCDVAARLQYEMHQVAAAVEDLLLVTIAASPSGSSDVSRAETALGEIKKLVDESDAELLRIDRYSREHTMWRNVAVAVSLQSLSVSFKKLPQSLDAAATALDKALAATVADAEAPEGEDAPPSPGPGSGEDIVRARMNLEKMFVTVSEMDRELRRAVKVAGALLSRPWSSSPSGVAELRDADDARTKAVLSATAALSASAQGLTVAMTSRAVQSVGQLMRLNSAVLAVEGALKLLLEGLGLPPNGDLAAAVERQLDTVRSQREEALEEAAAEYGGVEAANRAFTDPVGALLAAAQPDGDDDGGGGGARLKAGSGGGGAEVVFRPVFVQTARDPNAIQGYDQSQIQFHVAVLLKEPGKRAGPAPAEVRAVLERPAIRVLMEPLEHLLDVANNVLVNAHRGLRDMVSEADLLAPLLGLTSGTALLHTSRDGPAGLQVGAGRYGAHVEALVRANLRQVARHSMVQQSYKSMVETLLEGLQDAATRLSDVLEPVPVPYHARRVAQERNEELVRQTMERAAQEAEEARIHEAEVEAMMAPLLPPLGMGALLMPSPPSAPMSPANSASPRTRGSSRRTGSSTASSHRTRGAGNASEAPAADNDDDGGGDDERDASRAPSPEPSSSSTSSSSSSSESEHGEEGRGSTSGSRLFSTSFSTSSKAPKSLGNIQDASALMAVDAASTSGASAARSDAGMEVERQPEGGGDGYEVTEAEAEADREAAMASLMRSMADGDPAELAAEATADFKAAPWEAAAAATAAAASSAKGGVSLSGLSAELGEDDD